MGSEYLKSTPKLTEVQVQAQTDEIKARLVHIQNRLTDVGMFIGNPALREKFTDNREIPYKTIKQALDEGVIENAGEAFMLLDYQPQVIESVVADYHTLGAAEYGRSGLLTTPKHAIGKFATLITGDLGEFEDKPYDGLYLTKKTWQETVNEMPELLKTAQLERGKLQNIRSARVNETAARDIQQPPYALRTNYNSGGRWLGQRHVELHDIRPFNNWFPESFAHDDSSSFNGKSQWGGDIPGLGVRILGELEEPQD